MSISNEQIYALLLNKIRNLRLQLEGLPSPLIFRGNISSEADLPSTPAIGDMYNIISKSVYGEPGMNVAWSGDEWDPMGPTIDMSQYYCKNETDARYAPIVTQIHKTASDTSVNLEKNTFYIFPEMNSLTISLKNQSTGCYHFRFTSGTTATELTIPDYVKSDITIDPNRIYEISICDNHLAWTSWAV